MADTAENAGGKKPLKVQFITDVHHYARSLGQSGAAYDRAEAKSQKVIKDTDLVLKQAFKMLEADKSTDIVLLSGDTTKDGEIESHREIISMLHGLQKAGKRVYVITATHDYKESGFADGFDGDKVTKVPAVKDRHDLWKMYYDFGPSEAIATYEKGLSYVVQLAPGYRLFALNDDTNERADGQGRGSGYSDEHFSWIMEQLSDARKNDQFVIAMTHHPLISPNPFYSIIGKNDMQHDFDKTREILADSGLCCMLTGHTHVHNISYITTPKGNRFYDIACGATVGCPPVMRTVTFDPANSKIETDTQIIREVPGLDTGGRPFNEYMDSFFLGMIKDVVWSMGHDIDRLARLTPSFSIPPEKVYKNKWWIRPAGKFLDRLTFKKIWKLCKKESGLKKSDIADIADNKVVDFIVELVRDLYCGDAPYTPDTREYKLTCGFLNVIDSFLNTIHLKIGKFVKGAASVRSLVEPLLYNKGPCDDHATLKIYPLNDGTLPKPDDGDNKTEYTDTTKKSKKGPLVLAALILCVLIVLAILALVIWGIVALIKLAVPGTVPILPYVF